MVTYVPGAWFAVVGPRSAVLVPPEESARVAGLWELVQGEPALSELLDTFLRDGLGRLPSFALATWSADGVGVVLRGPVRVEAGGDAFDGAGISTWVERRFGAGDALTVRTPDAGEGAGWAVVAGVVLAGSLVVDTGTEPATAAPVAEAAPAPAPAPVPDPDATWTPGPADRGADPGDEGAAEPGAVGVVPAVGTVPPAVVPPAAVPAAGAADPFAGGYDELFGATVSRQPEDAAVRALDEDGDALVEAPAPASAEPAGPNADEPADHDGLTVFGSARPAPSPTPAAAAPPKPAAVARLEFSHGETVDLDRTVIAGRAPEARRFQQGQQPRLVVVQSPQLEVSGTHLELRPDDGSAVATDLDSTNGTTLTRPGTAPVPLAPGEPTVVGPGCVLDLGDGVTITVAEAAEPRP